MEINGFACRTCTDVALAKRHIDPAHPKDGPYGLNKPGAPNESRGLGPAPKVDAAAEKGLGPVHPAKPVDGSGHVLDIFS